MIWRYGTAYINRYVGQVPSYMHLGCQRHKMYVQECTKDPFTLRLQTIDVIKLHGL